MEVHPPEHPIHTWRDFLIHIATIVVGLLIAVALEQTVEWMHHKHLLHKAETNLRRELQENRRIVAQDQQDLDKSEADIVSILAMLSHPAQPQPGAHKTTHVNWTWNAPTVTAWNAARDTGAVGLMSYDQASAYSSIYGQQNYVDEQATHYIRDVYGITAPLQANEDINTISAAQRQAMTAAAQQSLADLRLLRDLTMGLAGNYATNNPD